MAGGTFNSGGVAQISLGTADPPSILLEGVVSANRTGQRPTTTDALYNQEEDDTEVGKLNIEWTVNGKCKSGAPGLILAYASLLDDTGPILYVAGSLEGTKGEVVAVRVSGFDVGFPDANKRCTYSIKLSKAGAITNLGGGAIFA